MRHWGYWLLRVLVQAALATLGVYLMLYLLLAMGLI